MVLSMSVAPVFLIIYIKFHKQRHQTWGGWSFESLTGWWQFASLGIPGYLTSAFEWWSFEISTFVVGAISEVQLAISTVLLRFNLIAYLVSESKVVMLTQES